VGFCKELGREEEYFRPTTIPGYNQEETYTKVKEVEAMQHLYM